MERAMEELTMSAPQEDLTGAWLDAKGEPRQVLDREEFPYDTVWRVQLPGRRVQFTGGEFICLNWTRVSTNPEGGAK